MGWFSSAFNSIKDVGKKVFSTTTSVGKKAFDIAKTVGKMTYEGAKMAHGFANKILPVLQSAERYIKYIPAIGPTINQGINVASDLNRALGEGIKVTDNVIKPALNPIENYSQIPMRLAQLSNGARQLDQIRRGAVPVGPFGRR
jgi:hypothetical protein